MKYYDPTTRKRPDFKELRMSMSGIILCICGTHLMNGPEVFNHWQQGHFDTYDEYKERKGFDFDSLRKVGE